VSTRGEVASRAQSWEQEPRIITLLDLAKPDEIRA